MTIIMAKQMLDIATAKTVDNAYGCYIDRTYQGHEWTVADYDFQNNKGETGKQYGVRDWSRANLNFEVVRRNGKAMVQPIDHNQAPIQERWQQRMDEGYKAVVRTKKGVFRKPIKNTEVKLVQFALGGNRERLHEMAFDHQVALGKEGIGLNGNVRRKKDIEKWALDCHAFLAKRYGAENILQFVVHLDETNPHAHVSMVPLTRDGKLSYTELFGGSREQAAAQGISFQKAMSNYTKQLHTDFHDEVGKKWGLDRGDSIEETGNKHKSTEESIREKQRLEDRNKQLRVENEQLESENKALNFNVTALRREKEELQGEVAEKRSEQIFGGNMRKFWWNRGKGKDSWLLSMEIDGLRGPVRSYDIPGSIKNEIGDDKLKLIDKILKKVIRIPETARKALGLAR